MFSNLANLLRYRGLITSLVARELKARYRGSMFGFFWSFINPLLLLLKVLFPAEVLPIVNVLANMVHFFLGLTILIAFLVIYQKMPDPWDLVWFPIAVVIQLVFTTALGLALAALAVHFRDIRDILANVLTLWFFATPIIYPHFQANVQKFKPLFNANPFTHLAISYQEILFFQGPIGHWRWLLGLGAASIPLFLACYWIFDRLRDSFAEAV